MCVSNWHQLTGKWTLRIHRGSAQQTLLSRKPKIDFVMVGLKNFGCDVRRYVSSPRFILNHESLTEEFCYMNRSGPYEPGPPSLSNVEGPFGVVCGSDSPGSEV